MLTAETALTIFLMLAISSISLFVAKRLKIPHTVLLVGIGIVLAVMSSYPYLNFLKEFSLTPELIFFIFLPILIFETAYNINIRQLTENAIIIGTLSIFSLLISALLIGIGLDFGLALIGIDIPFILSLIFGAIISATDPVAVLALFKEYGAPRRLSLIFEGESIFNDGTAVALFLVLLSIAQADAWGFENILYGSVSFLGMLVGGVLFGIVFGALFSKLVEYTKTNEFASITLMLVLAHSTFILAEIFSEHATILGKHIMVSPIIATAVASLFMGSYGRYKIPIHASEFVEKYWSHFGFLANSLIFIMIGMLAIQLPESTSTLFIPILISILVVAGARALSIYPIVGLYNIFSQKEMQVPRSWQHVLAWGSLRGALAVTMVLLVPDNFSLPNWNYSISPKEFLLTLTVGCVFTTLFLKATTIGHLMNKLKINTLTALEEINYREILLHIYDETIKKLNDAHEKGYINEETFQIILEKQKQRIVTILADITQYSEKIYLLTKVARLHAIGIERKYVRELFERNEINERIIKRIMAKLEYQSHAIECGVFNEKEYEHGLTKDIFEQLYSLVKSIIAQKPSEEEVAIEDYQYYRALVIISRKVVKELGTLRTCFGGSVDALEGSIAETSRTYERYHAGAVVKMDRIRNGLNTQTITSLDEHLTNKAIHKHELSLLETLSDRGMVTPKVAILLESRFEDESNI